jgi:hypothetical protein
MTRPIVPPWLAALDDDDHQFIRRFVLASGSLKALAGEYGVSYPTLRNRLDRLIAKIRSTDSMTGEDPFHDTLRAMVAGGQISADAARRLLRAHKESSPREEDTP